MKRKLIVLLVLCLFLSACGTGSQGAVTPTDAPTQTPTEPPTQEPTEPPTEPPPVYTNPLTGEVIEAPMYTRPWAVVMNNYKSGMPMHGIGNAHIVYEALTEAGSTRCVGLYTDIASQHLGSIRSARRHLVSVAISYDALFVHYGQSTHDSVIGAKQYIERMKWNNIDGNKSAYRYFYTNMDRRNNGWQLDACRFLVGQRAVDFANDKKYPLTREEPMDYGLSFAETSNIEGVAADKAIIWFNRGNPPTKYNKYSVMDFNPDTGLYEWYQFDKYNVDGNTNEVITFKNIIVLLARTKNYGNTSLADVTLEGSGTGYYACDGEYVPIRWSRPTAYDPFTYTLIDGTPLTMAVGKTYIAITPTNATIVFE